MSKRKGDPGYADGWCIHYQNPMEHKHCEAGIHYDEIRGIPFAERPCFLDHGKPKPGARSCPMLRLPTQEEIEAHEKWLQQKMDQMVAVMQIIAPWREKHKGRSAQETIECPICKSNLHLSISAYNGHVHGRCETDGCIAWME